MVTEDFNRAMDVWIEELEEYDLVQLCTKPSANSWSLGQVYMHLIDDTNYYVDQIKICVTTNDNVAEEASQDAKAMFLKNSFPDQIIEGPPSNANIRQPENKEQLMSALINLKSEMNTVGLLSAQTGFKGKTKHPGLGFFNAKEWLQFAEMHFRHHLRQKKRIDYFLKRNLV
jgi:hypothetical protein